MTAAGLKYAPVDDDTATLLDELAEDRITQAAALTEKTTSDPEWDAFLSALRTVAAGHGGRISPNTMRPLTTAKHADGSWVIRPQRRGPFYRRACLEGLIRLLPPAEWDVSNDTAGKNSGKYARTYVATPCLTHPNTEEHTA